MRPLQGKTDQLWMAQHLTQVIPNEGVEAVRRGETGGAAHIATTTHRVVLATADIIVVVGGAKPALALQLTVAAAYQAMQEVVVTGAPARQLLVGRQSRLDALKELLLDERRHWHTNPFLGWSKTPTFPTPDGLQGQLATGRRAEARALTVGSAGVAGVEQEEANGIGSPVRFAGWGGLSHVW